MILRVPLITLICLFTMIIPGIGQIDSPAGLIWDDQAYEELPVVDSLPTSVRGEELPNAISLKLFCPKPKNQGGIASCVGHALAHALTIEKAIKEKKIRSADKEALMHSASYIFNQIKLNGNCYSGASLTTGLKLLKGQGDCLTSHFENSGDSCHEIPDEGAKKLAYDHRIDSFCAIISRKWENEQKLENIRQALNAGNPVIVGMNVPANFKKWSTENMDTVKWHNSLKTGHAMVIVGYDHRVGTLEFMNSYGTSWGKGGFIELPYDLALPYLRYGFLLDYFPCD